MNRFNYESLLLFVGGLIYLIMWYRGWGATLYPDQRLKSPSKSKVTRFQKGYLFWGALLAFLLGAYEIIFNVKLFGI